jgi:hypothetical protein
LRGIEIQRDVEGLGDSGQLDYAASGV